ncbi:MAG: S53 family peptidase [Candidatus Pacebacteria bacterium]|nr:S53 family peptidase [Candidatus Paceibacterota bacterium]
MPADAAYHFADYVGRSPLHIYATTGKSPAGMTPSQIKKVYNLPATGGKGTIVIVGAYNDASIEKDLADFDATFNLPACTTKNGCFKRHVMSSAAKDNSSWDLETALDVEWAHTIAPTANILLVEAATPSGANLLKAVDYAAKQKGAAAIAMSWGGAEFTEETTLDAHFKSASGAPFFASSGDNGTGASWPAASPNVIGVGGTSVAIDASSSLARETAWQGSGGGVSAYEKAPSFQVGYGIAHAAGMRAVPDVAYDADPASGFPIIHNKVWRTVGGTSAGAPQWAAIAALGKGANATNFYADKSSTKNAAYFRDIVSGSNGTCGYYCSARMRYDYVTGLGTPQTDTF